MERFHENILSHVTLLLLIVSVWATFTWVIRLFS